MLSSETLSGKGWCHTVFMCSHFHTSTKIKGYYLANVTLDEYCKGSLSDYTYKTQNSWMHMTVIRMWLRPLKDHRMWHKMYKHMNNTGTVSQAIAQWSSSEGTSHMVHMEVLHTGSRSRALQDTWDNVAYTKMAWTDEVLLPQSYFSTYACPLEQSIPEWLQRSNWGNNTSNGAIKVVGCSWSHLQYCKCLWTIFEVIHDARIHKNNNAWYICTNKIMYRYLVQQVH